MSESLEEWIDQIREREQGRPKQLPHWDEWARAMPNELVRSALFQTRRRGPRRYYEDESVLVLGDGEIKYRGEELRTTDEDVWLQILHLHVCSGLTLGEEPVQFTGYSFMKSIGWSRSASRPSQRCYLRLRASLSRLQATTVTVASRRLGLDREGRVREIAISLIRKVTWTDGYCTVFLERELFGLFGDSYFTLLNWEKRKDLCPIEKKLYGYFCSHKRPFPVRVESLVALCSGAAASSERAVKKRIIDTYLPNLLRRGLFAEIRVIDGKIHVTRNSSAS